ncbi:MAG: peptide chain release factor N(5)-glutamine methyltransferase [Deltaproteobacteria bacterium]|nr:peptide chain release factor N(5)-glutamine methyltransferase [Deltaproteobacteria bacterium]
MFAIAEQNLTIREAFLWAEDYLAQHDVPDVKIEAEYLLAHALGCKRAELYLNPHTKIFGVGVNHTSRLSDSNLQIFLDFVERRIKREPSQYIIGEQEFWGLAFRVTPDVLIPRPETELLVEKTIKTVSSKSEVVSGNNNIQLTTHDSRFTILDLCTGSGCIAISLAKEIADCRIYAADISEKALAVARENAERHGVADKIHFLCGNLFEPLLAPESFNRGKGMDVSFDLVVSNPPYISKKMMAGLEPEVKDYEPRAALYGGEDGLDFYRRIISESPAYLSAGGYLILEIGYGQAEKIKRLIELSDTFEDINIIKDFSGIDRVIKAKRKG